MIIWGTRTKGEPRGFSIIRCARCGVDQPHFVAEVKKKFTVYFVPTFTLSRKAAIVCLRCELRSEVSDARADAYINGAMSQAAMVSYLERLDREASSGRFADNPGNTIFMLAIGMLVAGLEVALADSRVEDSESDAFGGAVREIAESSASSTVRQAAAKIVGELPELLAWVDSPQSPSIGALLGAAGKVGRALPLADKQRYFGQLGLVCYRVAEAGGPGAQHSSFARIDDVMSALSIEASELSSAMDYCERHGG